MKTDGKDMFTDPRFADHRAPMSTGAAILAGVGLGVILALIVDMAILTWVYFF